MQRKASNLVMKAAEALCAILGAPPFVPRAPGPAVVLVATRGRGLQDRATGYRQRYSRYLAAIGGVQRF